MDWFGKSSKAQGKNDMESLGIRFEPVVFYPDRNEYELCIELSGCPMELVKATYEMGKLKVEGEKYQTKFVKEFSIPADISPTRIYGLYEGEVLHIIMPRLLSGPRSEDASSKQEEDDDQKATTEVRENRDEVKDLAGGIKPRNSSSRQKDDVNAPFDREKSTTRVSTSLSSDQKATEDVNDRGGKERDELTSRVSAPSSFDHKEREGKDHDKLLTRVSTLLSSDQNERKGKNHDKLATRVSSSLSFDKKEMKEKEGKDRDKLLFRIPTLVSSDQKEREGKDRDKLLFRIPTLVSSDQKEREGNDRDKLLTRIPTSSSSDQKEMKEKEGKDRDKLRRGDNEPFTKISAAPPPAPEPSRSVKELGENYQRILSKTVPPPPPHAKSNDKDQSKVKKPIGDEGNKMLGLVAKVKENRLVVMIGAAVLTIVVLGASWRRKKKHIQINL